jgi:hypothetical protein
MAATAQLQPQSPPLYAWFQLVENSGNAFRNSRPSRVLLAAGAIVDDFCDAVKAECSVKLAHCQATLFS